MNITTKLNHISEDFITQYLSALGIEDIKHYLNPIKSCFEDPKKYDNIDKACKVLNYNIKNKFPIYIIRDSDTDGDCSSAIIYSFIKMFDIEPTVLYHTGKQHGLEEWMINEIKLNSLIIIPDASATGNKIIELINQKNCTVIELDHHLTTHEDYSIITVNNQRSTDITNKDLSGAGVADKFVRYYCKKYKIKYPDYTDLVAISLVSDICSLIPLENRAYMYYGLKNLHNPFLKFLFEKLCQRRGYNSDGISWNIAPLSNALARSDEQISKTLFFDGLVGKVTPEEALKEMRRVKRLQDEEVKSTVEEIEPNLDLNTKVILGFTEPENASYLGLIANKFTGKYNKPTILFRDTGNNSWSGSLRSPVPLATKINEESVAKAQGHEEACGVIVKKNKLTEFREWLENLDLSIHPDVSVVASLKPKDITIDLCETISNYKDLWGHGVNSPTFYLTANLTQDNVFIFEKTTTTLKLNIDGVGCLKFFAKAEDIEAFKKYKNFKVELVLGELSINEWEGIKSPQCIIQDYEITEIKPIKESWEDTF